MTADQGRQVTLDSFLLRLGNLMVESSVLYIVLAAWARPRSGPGSLLPLGAALALPIAFACRHLIESSTVHTRLRQAAVVLAAVGWGLFAASLVAPPGYWEREVPRGALALGAMTGNQPNAGLQPLAFWSSVLAWWRGHQLTGWDPTLDEALGRFRLCAALVGTAIILAATADSPGSIGLVQREQAAGVALFLVGALLTTASARRLEMAGGSPAAAPTRPLGELPSGGVATAGLIAGLVLTAFVIGALSALLLTPRTLAPALEATGQAIAAVGAASTWLFSSIASLVTGLLPPPAEPRAPVEPVIPFRGLLESLPVPDLRLPDWIGSMLFGLALALLFAAAVALAILTQRRLSNYLSESMDAVVGLDAEPPRPLESRGPAVIFGLLLRLLRRVRPVCWRRASPAVARPNLAEPRSPEALSVEAAYRSLLAWAEGQGLARRTYETPDELGGRLAAVHPTVSQPLELLTALFVEQQYGHHFVDLADVDRAQSALFALRAESARPAAVAGEPASRPA
jgi:hypothetical protein